MPRITSTCTQTYTHIPLYCHGLWVGIENQRVFFPFACSNKRWNPLLLCGCTAIRWTPVRFANGRILQVKNWAIIDCDWENMRGWFYFSYDVVSSGSERNQSYSSLFYILPRKLRGMVHYIAGAATLLWVYFSSHGNRFNFYVWNWLLCWWVFEAIEWWPMMVWWRKEKKLTHIIRISSLVP